MNDRDMNALPTAIKIERWYGFIKESEGIYSCRVCGTVVRCNETCSYCNSFPLVHFYRKALSAWLDKPEGMEYLPSYEARIRIYEGTINVQADRK